MNLKRVLYQNFGWGLIVLMLISLVGCECSKCRSMKSCRGDGSCMTISGQPNSRVIAVRPLTCPVSRDQVVTYTQDGKAELSCVKCGVAKNDKPCIECRAPKATPSADSCLMVPTNL